MLLLAIHSVQAQTATVHASLLTLIQAVKSKQTPPYLKCRQIFPTDGTRSTSLWDAPDQESLQSWLDESMDAQCNSEVFQVQEELAYGISAELTRLRATERMSANTRATAAAVQEKTKSAAADAQQRMGEIDAKLKVSEHAAAAYKSARETSSAAAKRTAEVFGKVGQSAQSSYSKALENERVAAAATAINTNVSAGWRSLSASFGGLMKGQTPSQGGSPSESSQEPRSTTVASGPSQLGRRGSKDLPQSNIRTAEQGQDGSLFTLDDSDEPGLASKPAKPSS